MTKTSGTRIKVKDLTEGMSITANIWGLSKTQPKKITRIEASSYRRGGMRIWVEGSDEMIGLAANVAVYQH